MMNKFLIIVLIFLSTIIPPAEASVCRTLERHSICILSIKRSAKNYWEYRATVQIDSVVHPVEIYNCRKQIRMQKDGKIFPFRPHGAGQLICNFFKR